MAFPKVLILEHLPKTCTPITSYIRVYERASLDNFCPNTPEELANSTLAFLCLDGHYVNGNGQPVADLSQPEPIYETVKSG